jgi:hypothetical protein
MVTGSVEHAKQLIDELPDVFDKEKVLKIVADILTKHSSDVNEMGAAILILYEVIRVIVNQGGNDE